MEPKKTEEVRDIYDAMASWWRWTSLFDSVLGMNRLRSRQFENVGGHVLDVGCGTGENFEYLRSAESLTAVDLSPKMAVEARRRAARLDMDVVIEVADAAALPFDDDRFDFVVSAYSSCVFPDYVGAFREMRRVAKTGGQILLVEHGRSSVGWIAQRQDRKASRHHERSGCRNNREPRAELEEAGLTVMSAQKSHFGMGNRIRLRVK